MRSRHGCVSHLDSRDKLSACCWELLQPLLFLALFLSDLLACRASSLHAERQRARVSSAWEAIRCVWSRVQGIELAILFPPPIFWEQVFSIQESDCGGGALEGSSMEKPGGSPRGSQRRSNSSRREGDELEGGKKELEKQTAWQDH